ncbi:CoA-binding protein, partial [Klebsiella oxytoca]
MSQRGLEALLRPKSIAVLGASDKVGRAGTTMMKNLLRGGFNGPVFPVNPTRNSVSGVFTYPSIDKLPQVPDLAIICTHHRRNLELLEQLGQSGCKAVIVLSAQSEQFQAIKTLCQQYHSRLLGPNSLGLLAPWQGLNASFSPLPVKKGKLAFISQSAAVANTILDWAYYRN